MIIITNINCAIVIHTYTVICVVVCKVEDGAAPNERWIGWR